jgi:hypothetical protein
LIFRKIHIILLIPFYLSCKQTQHEENPLLQNTTITQLIVSSDSILANQDIKVEVKNLNPDYPAYLLFQQPLMTSVFPITLGANPFEIVLDSTYTGKTGVTLLQLVQNKRVIEEKKINIYPNPAFRQIETFLGPRSVIVASGQDIMTIGIPTDQYDNPMKEETLVNYRYLRPNLTLETYTIPIHHLISYKVISPQEKKGKTIAGVICGEANSNEKEFNEEPGWATEVKLDEISHQSLADNRQFYLVKTLPIFDKMNNLVVDGTAVVFYVIDEEHSISRYYGITVNGVSEALIQNPPKGGKLEIYAVCGGVESAKKEVLFERTFHDFDVLLDVEKNAIVAGPIIANLNQYIPDGTNVIFEFFDNEKSLIKYERPSIKGLAQLKLRDLFLNSGKYRIKVSALEAKGEYILNYK